MYRGWRANVSRAGFVAAAELGTYDNAKVHLVPYLGDTMRSHFLAGFCGAVMAVTIGMCPSS